MKKKKERSEGRMKEGRQCEATNEGFTNFHQFSASPWSINVA